MGRGHFPASLHYCRILYTGRCRVFGSAQYIYRDVCFRNPEPDRVYHRGSFKYRRMVLRLKGMGERSTGHLNLEDFFRANDITEPLNDRINENVFALGSNAGMKLEQWGNTCIIVWMLLRSCRKITDAS